MVKYANFYHWGGHWPLAPFLKYFIDYVALLLCFIAIDSGKPKAMTIQQRQLCLMNQPTDLSLHPMPC